MPKPRKRNVRTGPARRARRDSRRERNRKQLIDATLELVAREGSGGLTATRIARAAGMDPSGFYAHFKSSKQCEQAAAAEFDGFVGSLLKPYLDVRALRDREMSGAALEQLLYAWLAEPRWSRLMLRARYEDSAFGDLTRGILEEVRKDVRVLLWDLAVASGAGGRHLDQIAALSEICVGHYMTLLEAVVQNRIPDVKLAAAAVARANVAAVVAELKRINREKPASA
ncbi:MAG TPA: TetR/AcrR family transcriptional regulator [Polyangiales bacterium]|jgi:AcrR family transcriptional regulator|nr:TetR/AcrR family transcriptional regulator [Polyangiales bacterium]